MMKLSLLLPPFALLLLCAPAALVDAADRPWLDGVPTPLPLLEKKRVSHDTHLYRFGLSPIGSDPPTTADGDQTLGIGVCSCLLVSPPSNRDLVRPYTPVSSRHDRGSFELIVKKYRKGAMGREFSKLRPGDPMVFWQIPKNIKQQYPFGKPRTIIMLAAGTGITPMFQALQRLFGPDDSSFDDVATKVVLIYGSRTKKDVFLRKEMEDMRRRFPHRLRVVHALSDGRKVKGKAGWEEGKIDKGMIVRVCEKELFHEGGSWTGCQVWVCGPPSFYEQLCGARDDINMPETCALHQLGFQAKDVVKF